MSLEDGTEFRFSQKLKITWSLFYYNFFNKEECVTPPPEDLGHINRGI